MVFIINASFVIKFIAATSVKSDHLSNFIAVFSFLSEIAHAQNNAEPNRRTRYIADNRLIQGRNLLCATHIDVA